MASPFRVFRRHQKMMLAVLGILVMFSFVFGGMISQIIGASRVQNPVVVSTAQFGDLRQSEIQTLLQRQRALVNIWQEIFAAATRKEYPKIANQIGPQMFSEGVKRIFGGLLQEDVVNEWLAAQYAEQMGIRISDDAIYQFLRDASRDKLSAADYNRILEGFNVTKNYFFDLMHEALARRNLQLLYDASVLAYPPAQRWDFYCRLHQKASIQYVALPVEQFIGRVKQEPTADELEEFFDKHRNQVPRPDSPEPGFTVPKKIDAQYFRANLADFTTPQTVSEEEIQAQYESNPKLYDQLNQEYLFQAETKKAAQKKEAEKKGSEKKEAEKKGPTAGSEPAKKPEVKEPAKSPAVNPPPAKKSELPAPETPPAKNSPKTSAVPSGSIRFASLADEKRSDPPPQTPPTPQDSGPGGKGETKKTAAPSAAASPAVKPSAEGKETKGSATPAKTASPVPPEAKSETPSRPRRELTPEVRDLIRHEVEQKKGRAAAVKKIKKIFEELQEIMKPNGRAWDLYGIDKLKGKNPPEPARLDFPALAKKFGCTSADTGLIANWETERWPIAQSLVQSGVTENPDPRGQAFTPFVFSRGTYHIEISATPDGEQWFLFWTIQDQQKYSKEHTPEFTDPGIREKALDAWRSVQARSLALQEAERLAGEARKNKESLKTLAERRGLKVHTPPAFTWYSGGDLFRRRQLQLGAVEGIPLAGNDFMQAVFSLDKGELGCAMNRPKTETFVVQALDFAPTAKALWDEFSTANFTLYADSAAEDMVRARAAWWKELQNNAGLKWKKPTAPAESRGGSEPYGGSEEEDF
jgi:hypothetical protein